MASTQVGSRRSYRLARGVTLGRSYTLRQPVADVIFARLPVTMTLGASAIAFALVLAIPLGVLAAVRPNSFADRFALTLSVIDQAMPTFWFALTLILWLGVVWRLLPITGSDSWKNFVMPAIALGYYVTPAVMRLTRGGVLEVLSSDYIRTARAKGLRPNSFADRFALTLSVIGQAMPTFWFALTFENSMRTGPPLTSPLTCVGMHLPSSAQNVRGSLVATVFR
jgi:ABC-type dipeptide/oligopeptide/nickel transport system permease component